MRWILWATLATTFVMAAGVFPGLSVASDSGEPAPSSQHLSATVGTGPGSPLVVAAPKQVEPVLTQAALRSELIANEVRLRQAIKEGMATSVLEKLWPALLGLAGVLLGGVINIWLHSKQRVAAERANRSTAAFAAQTKIIEHRSRQAHEFYYPLFLSLQRSAGIRRQICDHLHAKRPDRFRFARESDGREHLFIYSSETEASVRLRLIEAMHEIATDHPEVLPMVEEIVGIGEQMSALIHDKGGLVLASSTDLTETLGSYLAHFSILREVARKAANPSSLAGISYNVLYPTSLETGLADDIAFLQKSIGDWSIFSAELWAEAMPGTPMPALTRQIQPQASGSP